MPLFELPLFTICERTGEGEKPLFKITRWVAEGKPEPKHLLDGSGRPVHGAERWGYYPLLVMIPGGGDEPVRCGLLFATQDTAAMFLDMTFHVPEEPDGNYYVLKIDTPDKLRRVMKVYEEEKVSIFAYDPVPNRNAQLFGVDSIPRMMYTATGN